MSGYLMVGFVAVGIPLSVLFGAWVVWRLRYQSKARVYVVCVDKMTKKGEVWWISWVDGSSGVVFASRSEDKAVAYALDWQSRELKGEK
jgi:hypothetical protein